jgi:exopolysaccharide production protein ExoQ
VKIVFPLMMTFAFLTAAASVLPSVRKFGGFTRDEKFVASYLLFLIAWPLIWTYTFGPLIHLKPSGALYPVIWFFPAMLTGAVLFIRAVRLPGFRIDLAALLQFSLSIICLGMLAFSGFSLNNLIHLTVAMLFALPTLVKTSRIRLDAISWSCRVSVLVVISFVWLATLVNRQIVVGECRADKCSVAGLVITSPFSDNGNLLGLSLVMLLPFAIYRNGFARTALMVIAIVVTADLAGGRTAEAGLVLTIPTLIATWAWPNMRRQILVAGLAIATVVSLIPAVIPFNNDQFVGRAMLWNEGRQLIGYHPILGSGAFAWTVFGKSAIGDANYSPHNGWLDTVLAVGLSGLAVLVIAVLLKMYSSRRGELDVLLLYFANLLIISTLESVYVPYNLGIIAFAGVLPFLIGIGGPLDRDVGELAAESADEFSSTPMKWRD